MKIKTEIQVFSEYQGSADETVLIENVRNKESWAVKITIGDKTAIVAEKDLRKAIDNAIR